MNENIKRVDIHKAIKTIREKTDIPREILDFMRDASLEKLSITRCKCFPEYELEYHTLSVYTLNGSRMCYICDLPRE